MRLNINKKDFKQIMAKLAINKQEVITRYKGSYKFKLKIIHDCIRLTVAIGDVVDKKIANKNLSYMLRISTYEKLSENAKQVHVVDLFNDLLKEIEKC